MLEIVRRDGVLPKKCERHDGFYYLEVNPNYRRLSLFSMQFEVARKIFLKVSDFFLIR